MSFIEQQYKENIAPYQNIGIEITDELSMGNQPVLTDTIGTNFWYITENEESAYLNIAKKAFLRTQEAVFLNFAIEISNDERDALNILRESISATTQKVHYTEYSENSQFYLLHEINIEFFQGNEVILEQFKSSIDYLFKRINSQVSSELLEVEGTIEIDETTLNLKIPTLIHPNSFQTQGTDENNDNTNNIQTEKLEIYDIPNPMEIINSFRRLNGNTIKYKIDKKFPDKIIVTLDTITGKHSAELPKVLRIQTRTLLAAAILDYQSQQTVQLETY